MTIAIATAAAGVIAIATVAAIGGGMHGAGNAAASGDAAPSAAPQAVLEWMREQAVPVSLHDGDGLLADAGAARRLGALVGDARVVAIGEPTHGAHEPLALRNRLFRHLVEHEGFTVIAVESGLTESRTLDAYVQGGPGEAAEVAREGFTWGFGAYPENVALLRWMRAYNREAAPARRLRIYGYDLSGGAAAGFPHARVPLDQVLAWLRRVAPEHARAQIEAAAPLAERFDPARYAAQPEAARRQTAATLDGLADWLRHEREALVAASSADDHDWALRNAIGAQQLAESLRLLPADAETAGITPDMHAAMSLRDLAMADNLQWMLDREPDTARMLVFGHNAHVADAPVKGGLWSALEQAPSMLGQHLRQRLGDGYVVVGTLSSRNEGGLPPAVDKPEGLEDALARVGSPAFLLPLRGAPAPVAAWLAQERPVRVNFVTEMLLRPAVAFDAVIHVEALHPAGWPDTAPRE